LTLFFFEKVIAKNIAISKKFFKKIMLEIWS